MTAQKVTPISAAEDRRINDATLPLVRARAIMDMIFVMAAEDDLLKALSQHTLAEAARAAMDYIDQALAVVEQPR